MPPSLSGGAIARGSVFSIFGVRFGPGASVKISNSSGAMEALPVFAGAERIDAMMPRAAPLGPVSLTVTWRGQTSQPYELIVAESSFGIFTQNGQGWGPALAPASFRPGEIVTLEGTGMGAARPRNLEVIAGGRRARILQTRAATQKGHDQIRFRIPKGVPLGCSVPLQVRTTGGIVSNTATLAIDSRDRNCHAGDHWLVSEIESGGKRGIILLLHSGMQVEIGSGAPMEFWSDDITALFRDFEPRTDSISRLRMLPPAGVCSSYAGTTNPGKLRSALSHLGAALDGRLLDAGPHLKLSGPSGDRDIGKAPKDWQSYKEQLGGKTLGLGKPTPLFLTPGDYDIRGEGGADVASFRASLRVPPPVVWTNQGEITSVNRARGVTLRWTGTAPRDQAGILAVNLDQVTGATGVCLCLPKAGTSEFSVPPAALANFPASPHERGIPTNFLALLTISGQRQLFQAKGLEQGVAGWMFVNAKSVPFE